MILTPDPNVIEAAQASAEIVHEGASSPERDVVSRLTDSYMIFRRKRYRVGPPPYKSTMRLQQLAMQAVKVEGDLQLSDDERVAFARDMTAECVSIFRDLVRPVGLARLSWAWRRNPFEAATEREVQELLVFFAAARTRSSLRIPNGVS